jgi:N-acetylglucosamine-6-phosphate deacetylase
VLVTDASQAAGLGDGVYIRPGNRKVIVENGAVRLESGALAGSVLTMSQAVANAAKFLGIPLADAIAMASAIAAESLGLQDSRGSLAPGKLADLVIMDENVQIQMTIARGASPFQWGKAVWRRNSAWCR